MMKKTVIFFLAILLLLLSFSISASSENTGSESLLNISFVNPIVVTVDTNSEIDTASRQAINAVIQSGYDAFVMDYPLRSMWLDMRSCKFNGELSTISNEGSTQYVLTKMSSLVVPSAEYPNPAGMVAIVNQIIDRFQPAGETMFEKVQSIHDYLCRRITYSISAPHAFSAYGALADRQSVCEGYAEAFKIICEKNKIDCVLVVGSASNGKITEHHEWNMVRMEDDLWYAVDVTWDDVGGRILSDYFLVGSDTIIPSAKNSQFKNNHTTSPDVSFTDNPLVIQLTYPELSYQSYAVNHEKETALTDYSFGVSKEYYRGQLSENEKAVYDALKAMTLPSGPPIDYHEDSDTDRPVSVMTTDIPDQTSFPDETTRLFPDDTASMDTTGIHTADSMDAESSVSDETAKINGRGTTDSQSSTPTDTTTDDAGIPITTENDTTEKDTSACPDGTTGLHESEQNDSRGNSVFRSPYFYIGTGCGIAAILLAFFLIRKTKIAH